MHHQRRRLLLYFSKKGSCNSLASPTTDAAAATDTTLTSIKEHDEGNIARQSPYWLIAAVYYTYYAFPIQYCHCCVFDLCIVITCPHHPPAAKTNKSSRER